MSSERFSLLFALIGLATDIVGLSVFAASSLTQQSSNPNQRDQFSAAVKIMSGFLLIYGWLTLCWAIVRRSYVDRINPRQIPFQEAMESFVNSVMVTVLMTYLLLSPLWMLWGFSIYFDPVYYRGRPLPYAEGVFVGLFTETIVGALIWLILPFTMPLIYPDMNEYHFPRSGK
jgi:uncharacterized membrane protein YidH (DUF202 family)